MNTPNAGHHGATSVPGAPGHHGAPSVPGAPGHHGALLNYAHTMDYGDYLQLDAVLSAQKPLSPDANELLFIVQHQTSELWMKLLLHELDRAMQALAAGEMAHAFKMMARASRILEQLVHAWDVLATMTPPEYSAIRPHLGQSSGFQSWQYRCIEFKLGNKVAALLQPHAHHPQRLAAVQAAYGAPSLYDLALQLLAQRGLDLPASHTQRDWTQPYAASDAVQAAWLQVYQAPDAHWDLYQLAEELVDLEDAFRLWRFRHVTTVERIIGHKGGTGGTGGVSYLRRMLDVVLFPELWRVRTAL
jgi:tryptophan 2,3-dioxygenase